MPVRLQLSRRRGFVLQAASVALNGLEAVNVARPGKWGNPFVVGKHGTRARCVELFEYMCGGYTCVSCGNAPEQVAYTAMAKRDRGELRGKNLACWCALPRPGEPDLCHARILLGIANS